ncbi:hypothetical protein COOONC_06352 [Cooperia oncophora]
MDTGERLGPPLTALIDTFVSVAGGLFRQRYEGRHIFSIYSPQDDKVGFKTACGQLASSIAGADREFQESGNHDQVMANTIGLQSKLIRSHTP